jgi:hypothetical protein
MYSIYDKVCPDPRYEIGATASRRKAGMAHFHRLSGGSTMDISNLAVMVTKRVR